jgi:hypothetical protein
MHSKPLRSVRWLAPFGTLIGLALVIYLQVPPVMAGDTKIPKGWELGGAYDKNYNPNELDKFRAWVVAVKKGVPMKGMAPGVFLEVKEGKDDEETILVHLCPTAYMGPKQIGLRRGDRIKIRGSWAFIDGKDIFMAAKIKKGDYFELKVRLTSNGKPFWTMTPEELAKEKNTS